MYLSESRTTGPGARTRDFPAAPRLPEILRIRRPAAQLRPCASAPAPSCAGLLLLAEGPCLSWLPLAFLARLPGLDLKPLPLTFDRRCYRTGLVARRSAVDLAPVRRFEHIVRDIALERPDGSNLPALAGRAPSRSAVRRLGDDRALVVGRSGNGHALSGESGDRDTLISSAGTIDGSPALGRTRSPAALDPEEETD